MISSQVLQKKSWLVASSAVWFLVLVGFFGGSRIFAAEYAMDKGSNMFGINLGVINASGDLYEAGKESFTLILLMPQTVHFYERNLGVGADLLMLLTAQGKSKSTTIGVGPKIIYFFGGREAKHHPYVTSGFYYLRNDIQSMQVGMLTEGLLYGTRFKLGLGSNWSASPHLGVLMEASFNWDNLDNDDTNRSASGNMVIFTIGLVGFGF